MTETRPTKAQQTRTALIEAAYKQFTEKGFHAASMRQIAEAAGMALGGIYNHFASKDELFKAVILAYHPLTLVVPGLLEVQGESSAHLLHDAVLRLYAAFQTRPDVLNLLFIELVECRGTHLVELLPELLPHVLLFAQRLADMDDRLRPLPPAARLRFLFGSLLGFVLTEHLLKQMPAQLPGMGDIHLLVDVLLHGLEKESLSGREP